MCWLPVEWIDMPTFRQPRACSNTSPHRSRKHLACFERRVSAPPPMLSGRSRLTEVITRLNLRFGQIPNHFPVLPFDEDTFTFRGGCRGSARFERCCCGWLDVSTTAWKRRSQVTKNMSARVMSCLIPNLLKPSIALFFRFCDRKCARSAKRGIMRMLNAGRAKRSRSRTSGLP